MATGAVVARILSQYSDKGSKQAQKDIKKLGQNIDAFGKKASRSFALVGAATAAFASKLAIDAVKGAAADEKQQAALAVALRNTTGATDAAIAANAKYLDSLELQVAIDNEKLIPALQTLVTATGDLTQAQGLLTLATDVSAASGKDLGAVSMALSKAVNGNFGALTKLGLPLDAAAIKSKDLGAILVQLARISSGQADAAANTFSGTLERLRLSFNQIADSVGSAMIPALTTFALYLQSTVIPQLDYFVFLNEYKLQNALMSGVENIKEIVRAFTNIYNVIRGINEILPFGIAGWIQIGVALAIVTKLGMLYNAAFTALGIVSKAGATALTQAAAAGLANAAAQGANATGSAIAAGWMAKLSLAVRAKTTAMIADTVATYRLSVSTQLLGVAMKTGAGSVSLMNLALIRLGATLKAAMAFLAKYFKQILLFIATMEALDWVIKKLTGDGGLVKLSKEAQALSYEFWKADKATESMDDALNAYRASQNKKINKTKEEIELEKLLASMKARSLAEDKKRAKFEADYAKLNKKLADRAGVKLLSGDDEKLVQINAAIALNERQEKLDKINLSLLKTLREEVLLQKVKNDLAERYNDILKVLALSDDKLPSAIAVLAAKWGTTTEAVRAYILQFQIVQDGTISDDEVTKLAMSWGSTKEQAAKYLDFFVALNDGVLDTIEIDKLKTKWSMTEQQVRMYADFVGVVNDGKLEDKEVQKLMDKWKLSTDQVVEYIKQIGSPVSYSGTLIDPAKAAEIGWKNALAALLAYQAALGNKGTSSSSSSSSSASSSSSSAASSSAASSAAAASSTKAAESAASAIAYAVAAATGDTTKAALAAAGVTPSALASQESGAIGAASIAAQLKAAEEAVRISSSLAAFKAKEAADLAASQAAAQSMDYDERFRFRNSMTMDNSKSLMAGGMASGSNTTVNVTVNGTIQTEQDLVSSIRQGLLAGQTNGQGLTLQAI
jgi:hypothetical protein